ncbi:MAG: hypothetical protein R3E96_05575 [Planctomycetota bacterium]
MIRAGQLVTGTGQVQVTYQAQADADGSISTSSIGKTNLGLQHRVVRREPGTGYRSRRVFDARRREHAPAGRLRQHLGTVPRRRHPLYPHR